MLNYKILLWLLVPLFCSCMERRVAFSLSRDIDTTHFFNDLVKEARLLYPHSRIESIDSIKLYTAVYRESYIESNQLLEWTELHDSSRIPRVDYYKVFGHSTRLFMGSLHTYPDDIKGIVFFSARFNYENQCLGFGPAYFGILDTAMGTAAFTTVLDMKRKDGIFKLKTAAVQNRKSGILFVADEFHHGGMINHRKPVKVEKIVLLDPNKIGGNKPVVFNVKQVLQDDKAMQFRYFKTLFYR